MRLLLAAQLAIAAWTFAPVPGRVPTSAVRRSALGREASILATDRRTVTTAAAAWLLLRPLSAAAAPPGTRVRLSFASAAEGLELGDVAVELTGGGVNAEAVATFRALAAGTQAARCDRAYGGGQAVVEKERLETARVLKRCVSAEETPLTYDGSTVWRVVPGKRIDCGALSSKYAAREPPSIAGDNGDGALTHDAAGVVSMFRGDGGGGGFVIAPGPNPALDADYVIVGRVVDAASLAVVAKLNDLPLAGAGGVSLKGKDIEERTKPATGCRYGGASYYCAEGKPLRKVTMASRG